MIEAAVQLINKLGLHARASAKLVSTAAKFQSELWISTEANGKRINGKSIMAVMTLGAPKDTVLYLSCEGKDEKDLLEAITAVIKRRFDEEE